MTKEVDEMSAASRGSQPFAWAADIPGKFGAAPTVLFGYTEKLVRSIAAAGGDVVRPFPLYRQPTLTDEEREAIGWYAAFGSGGRVATLRSLLGRLSPRSYGETTEKRCIVNTISKKTSNFYEQDSVILVDPPQGWKFGFPKRWDRAKHPDCREWMISEGYPRELAELNLPCTFTSVTDEC